VKRGQAYTCGAVSTRPERLFSDLPRVKARRSPSRKATSPPLQRQCSADLDHLKRAWAVGCRLRSRRSPAWPSAADAACGLAPLRAIIPRDHRFYSSGPSALVSRVGWHGRLARPCGLTARQAVPATHRLAAGRPFAPIPPIFVSTNRLASAYRVTEAAEWDHGHVLPARRVADARSRARQALVFGRKSESQYLLCLRSVRAPDKGAK
jgi:hypothetical protein